MGEQSGPVPPTAEQIHRRFRGLPVRVTRPVIVSAVQVLKLTRRFRWEAEGLENIRGLETPLVFAANHRSHTDTGAILGTLPRAIRNRTAVAAALDVFGPSAEGKSLRNESFQLIVAAGFHAFAFDRHGSPLRSIRTSAELVRMGWSLLLYPEGTRSRSGELGPFKAGIGVLARFTGRPVVPIHVAGGERVHPYGRRIPGRGRMVVRYGEPLTYRRGETPSAFAIRLRDKVGSMGGDVLPSAAPVGEATTMESPVASGG
jgi:1-acyl-sn-glycerol-3-phosphate acyltransferase